MATKDAPSSSSHEVKKYSLTCSLCLDIFTDPKLLPCSHTFCLKCLEDMCLSSSSCLRKFPCPYCRFQVTVPAGGLSAFSNNIYIHTEDLDIAREGTNCLNHPDQKLDLYCAPCELPVCLKCVLVEHKLHTIQNLYDAAKEARSELGQVDEVLQTAASSMKLAVELEQTEQQDLQDKKAALQTVILNKHGVLVALADKYRDELLASLDDLCGSVKKTVDENFTARAGHQQSLNSLQLRLQHVLMTGTAMTLVAMAKDMREGKGLAKIIENMTSGKRKAITRPVLSSSFTLDALKDNIKNFFGTAHTINMGLAPVKVVVEKKFTCMQEKDTEVFSLCPLDDDAGVLVSYVSCGLRDDANSDFFSENGDHQISFEKARGKCSFKSRGGGEHLLLQSSASTGINTNSKNKDGHNYHLTLCHSLKGKSSIKKMNVKSEHPFETEDVTEFTISAGPHRAFDVDSTEQIFAVVEEPEKPDEQRKVRLYQRNRADAIATYTAPSKPFNPADVCFFTLGNEEVLMVADEAGDSIHVVRFAEQRGAAMKVLRRRSCTMEFVQHLVPGYPSLVQPTALNVDQKRRLWVACRGGAILTMSWVSNFPEVFETSDC